MTSSSDESQLVGLEQELDELAATVATPEGVAIELWTDAIRSFRQDDYAASCQFAWQAAEAFTKLGRIDDAGFSTLFPLLGAPLRGHLGLAHEASDRLEEFARVYHYETGLVFAGSFRLAAALLRWRPGEFLQVLKAVPWIHSVAIECMPARFLALQGRREDALRAVPRGERAGVIMQAIQDAGHRSGILYLLEGQASARADFDAWVALWREGVGTRWQRAQSFAPVAACLVTMGDADLVAQVYQEVKQWKNWCGPLSGLGIDPARGQLALRLGLVDEAGRAFADGVEWAEREDCPVELGRNLQGLAAVAEQRGDTAAALAHLDRAAALYQPRGIKLYLDQVIAAKVRLQGLTSDDLRSSIVAVREAVETERPNLATHAAPDGTVTLMFSDIEGSTPLNEQLGDQRWMEVLGAHHGLVEAQVSAHRGYVVKTMGDGYMVAFKSAAEGLRCGLAIQQAFASPQHQALSNPPIRVRIGLHTGEAVRQGGDFFGTHVNLAARVAGAAAAGEVLVSALLHDLVASSGEFTFDGGRELTLKGLTGQHRVFAAS